jgi:allantoinase
LTGTYAAASGGVTTLIDMPLNSIPPTTTIENLHTKQVSAREVGVYTDVGFWGGIIPGNAGDLKGLVQQGVKGFKCFLIESGVEVSSSRGRGSQELTRRNSLVSTRATLSKPAMPSR